MPVFEVASLASSTSSTSATPCTSTVSSSEVLLVDRHKRRRVQRRPFTDRGESLESALFPCAATEALIPWVDEDSCISLQGK